MRRKKSTLKRAAFTRSFRGLDTSRSFICHMKNLITDFKRVVFQSTTTVRNETRHAEPHLQRRLLLLALVQRRHDLAPLRPHPDRGHEEASEAVRNFAAGHQERVPGVLVHGVALAGHARLIDGQGVAGHEDAVRGDLRTVRVGYRRPRHENAFG